MKKEITTIVSLREAVRRSGLTPQTIHIWEARYGVVDPRRTHANRLVYSEADVHRLTLLSKATDAGHRIADVANMPIAKLEKLVAGVRLRRKARL